MALSFAENGHTVLYLASKPLDKLPYSIKHTTDTLKKIIFMYFNTDTLLLQKLVEIHNWNKSPKLIIIESLETFFNFETQTYDKLICAHTLLLATLHNCATIFAERFPNKQAFSLISVNTDKFELYKKMVQILVDLYYYKNNWMIMDENTMQKLRHLFELS